MLNLAPILDRTLAEDIPHDIDITTETLKCDNEVNFKIISKENLIFCGKQIIEYFFTKYDIKEYKIYFNDGEYAENKSDLVSGVANAKIILILERTILNFLQHLSGIATLTNEFVLKIKNTKAKITDTRKTLPGLKALQKYAVRCGGGQNHRFDLGHSILIKDNHIKMHNNDIKNILQTAKQNAPHYIKIEIECSTIDQVMEALNEEVDTIMLDNMSIKEIQESVALINGKSIIEVSGGITLENVEKIANTGVDIISVGYITHSVKAVDISLKII